MSGFQTSVWVIPDPESQDQRRTVAALEGPPSEWDPILLALEGQGLDALASASTTSLMILVSAHGHRPHPPLPPGPCRLAGFITTQKLLSPRPPGLDPPASFISHLGFHPPPTSVLLLPLRGRLLSPLCGFFSGKFCPWPWSLH